MRLFCLAALLAACGSTPTPTGDMNTRDMTFKGPREEIMTAAVKGLQKRGFKVQGVNRDRLFIQARGGGQTCIMRGQDKGDRIKFEVGLSGGALQLEWRKISNAITDELDKIMRAKEEQQKKK